MAEEVKETRVDETHISPIERRNSLEKHLQTRPDPKDLKDRHILLDTNAAPFVFPEPQMSIASVDEKQGIAISCAGAGTSAGNRQLEKGLGETSRERRTDRASVNLQLSSRVDD